MYHKHGNLYQTLGKKAHDHVYDLVVHERMSPRKVANVFGIDRNHVLCIVREIAPSKLNEISVTCVCILHSGRKVYLCSACRSKRDEYLSKWGMRHANALRIVGMKDEWEARGFMQLATGTNP
jgi:hypothetical protein